ncbi:Phototropic-responsive NPH3 family protein isoform 2 [Hibiscus syriacus]|uniref:Phototropic-responsive NPH3 family protein isoform 2 n=1 Tax=Hibiscus syriacus TaxID=106335 RepID=A0A6A2WM14_HIBSY|nr:Phototropic-responsive NPH3 family protein isoform 2 [Hibiscus syriacus]
MAFPLLSKSNRIQKLVLKASEDNCDKISMVDFPGGASAFEICAKFCYGMTVTLNAYNVVAARCATEYLEMTKDVDRVQDKIVNDSMKLREKIESVPKDWWVEDICELEIDLYKRVMTAVKSKGRMDGAIIGEALKTYAVRWFPDSVGVLVLDLHEASVKDLLILARSPQTTLYDVGMVQLIVNMYVIHEKHSQDVELGKNEMERTGFVLGHGSSLCVGKHIDKYLQEIAHNLNLSLASFIDLSQSISELARPVHDGLYKAIDIYLKKLTMDASMHAAHNERLSLCVVVRVIFFEQVKAAAGAQSCYSGPRSKATTQDRNSLEETMRQVQIEEDGIREKCKLGKNSKTSESGMQLLPSRSRRIFGKLWVVGKGHAENRSSETSRSSGSPTSVVVRGETKSSGFSSRHGRYSVS